MKKATHAPASEGLARLASILDGSEDAIITKDLDGTVQTWNPAAQRLYGYTKRQIVGRSITMLIPSERLAEERMIVARIRRGRRVEHYETTRLRKDGGTVNVSISVSPIRDSAGRIVGASNIGRDITERMKAEAAARETEQRIHAILDGAADAIITISTDGLIESANRASERLFGYAISDLVGRNVRELMPEPHSSEHSGYLQRYLRTGRAKIIGIGREVVGRHRNGTLFPLHLSVSEVRLEGRSIFTGILHDLSNRRELEREVLEANMNEQRRIGQDLHDGLCQDLLGIAFNADHVATQLHADNAEALVRGIAASVREATSVARHLSHNLYPIHIREGGLATALGALAEKTSASFHVQCSFRETPNSDALSEVIATHLYRIAQEAIANAIRHGKAKLIEIDLERSVERIALTIRDNGEGFQKSGAEEQVTSGIGLQTMRYRAHLMGGDLDVRSSDGKTHVCCSITSLAPKTHAPTTGRITRPREANAPTPTFTVRRRAHRERVN